MTVPADTLRAKLVEIMRPIDQVVFNMRGDTVWSGPFEGMQIPQKPIWEDANQSVKLIGIYERELHDVITKAIARNPQTIVNVGCAEGYYAVGLARCLPQAKVFAFDKDLQSVLMCSDFGQRNGVSITAARGCEIPSELDVSSIGGHGNYLYVVDVEGDEDTLLDPSKCKVLCHSDIIVEVHEFLIDGLTERLRKRFQETHDIEVISQVPPSLFEAFNNFNWIVHLLIVTEKRPLGSWWLACWAKQRCQQL